MLVIITAPHFCAAFDPDNGTYAPIIKYMKGWSMEMVMSYCAKNGWSIKVIEIGGDADA